MAAPSISWGTAKKRDKRDGTKSRGITKIFIVSAHERKFRDPGPAEEKETSFSKGVWIKLATFSFFLESRVFGVRRSQFFFLFFFFLLLHGYVSSLKIDFLPLRGWEGSSLYYSWYFVRHREVSSLMETCFLTLFFLSDRSDILRYLSKCFVTISMRVYGIVALNSLSKSQSWLEIFFKNICNGEQKQLIIYTFLYRARFSLP